MLRTNLFNRTTLTAYAVGTEEELTRIPHRAEPAAVRHEVRLYQTMQAALEAPNQTGYVRELRTNAVLAKVRWAG